MPDQVDREVGDLELIRTKAGRIHRVVRVGDTRFTNEQCNVDDVAGELETITFAQLETADPGDLCQHCWPPKGAQPR